MKHYHWLLFDLDNTIFDFTASSRLAFNGLLEEYNIDNDQERFETYTEINGRVWKELEQGKIKPDELKWKRFQLFFEAIGEEHDPHKANQCYLDCLVDNFRFIDKAYEIVNHLHGQYKLAAITNGLKRVQRPRLIRSGINDLFDVIVVSEEIGHAKPHAEFFDHAFLQMANPEKSQAIVIGDNLGSDIKGAHDYGVDACWYNPGKKENNITSTPKITIADLGELLELFDKGK